MPAAVCSTCQRQIRAQEYRSRQAFWRSDLPVFPWGEYSGALRRSLTALKYERQPQIAQPLGRYLAQAWLASAEHKEIKRQSVKRQDVKRRRICRPLRITVIPIPMYAEKRRQRGYDQAVLIAQQFCAVTRYPLQRQGLIRGRATSAQFGLSPSEREANLAGAFRVSPALAKSRSSILLIDDIYTTGATARAAADVLQRAGLPVLGLLAVASPSYRR
ncbi:MAG: ComF family protein [Elainellaceae cyanobacterium]